MIEDLYNSEGRVTGRFADIGAPSPYAAARQQMMQAQIADWNRQSAMQPLQREEQEPDYRRAAVQSMMQQYQQKAPSFAMAGNEVLDNGSWRPLREGENPNVLRDAAQQATQNMYLNRLKGNLAAGTKERKLLADRRFQQLTEDDQRELYRHIYGVDLDEDLFADQLGGNMTVADVRLRRQMPELSKQAAQQLAGVEASHGFNPIFAASDFNADRKSGYDPVAQVVHIPGATRVNPTTGMPIQQPAQQIPLPAEARNRMRDLMALQWGFRTHDDMERQRMARQAAMQMSMQRGAGEAAQTALGATQFALGGNPQGYEPTPDYAEWQALEKRAALGL